MPVVCQLASTLWIEHTKVYHEKSNASQPDRLSSVNVSRSGINTAPTGQR